MKQEYKERYQKFGLNVVYYRKMKRLTQLQLAESMDVIFKLCDVLEVTPKELFVFRD